MWNENDKSEIACILASLILNENDILVSENNLKNIFITAGVKIDNFWPPLFTRLIKNLNLEEFIGFSKSEIHFSNPKNKVNEEKITIEQQKEIELSDIKESDEDMGFGLFD